MSLQIIKVGKVVGPYVGRSSDCGYDLFVPTDFTPTLLLPHTQIKIKSGLRFNVPEGFGLFCFDRSSVSTKIGLKVLAPVIDPSYTGEVSICVYNYTNKPIMIYPDMKIIQVVLMPYIKPQIEFVDMFEKETTRGDKGFGSTNNN